MKRWLPDYSNTSSIMASSQKSYTMSADGFISLGLFKYTGPNVADARIAVTINGVQVGFVGSGAIAQNNARQVTYTNMFPVLAGDVVTVDFSSDVASLVSIYFIPGKWA